MISYDALALNREQMKILTQNADIPRCRDIIHEDARKNAFPPLIWATSFSELIAMTEDGPNPLAPFQIRYKIQMRKTDQ